MVEMGFNHLTGAFDRDSKCQNLACFVFSEFG